MGIFSMLKNNDAGIKLSKFKQSKMKEYLKGQLDPDNFKIVEGGACMTYTMEWLSQSLGGGPTKGSAAFSRGADTPTAQNPANQRIASFAAENYTFASAFQGTANVGKIIVALAEQKYGLHFTGEVGRESSFFDMWMTLPRLSAGAYYLSCGVKGQAFRHAVGWSYLDSDHLFFDPNIGEYKVLNHEKFGIEYFKQCEAACGIQYTDAIFFRFYLRL
jgi:Yersinia/Haemophilus virulence surface antigen